jgi:hypothetical protein
MMRESLKAWRTLIAALDENGRIDWEETLMDATFSPAKEGARSRQDQTRKRYEVGGGEKRRSVPPEIPNPAA